MASFRHLGRFPVVCFHHKKNKAVLLRCGQPLCGTSHKRCREDVTLLNACLPSLGKGKVLDIRPSSVAQSHMSKGNSKMCLCSLCSYLKENCFLKVEV